MSGTMHDMRDDDHLSSSGASSCWPIRYFQNFKRIVYCLFFKTESNDVQRVKLHTYSKIVDSFYRR